jgi:RNA-binding protein
LIFIRAYLLVTDNSPMTALKLPTSEIKDLRADAHHLSPVVQIGNDGLSAAVLKEVDAALNSHGLIKVRAFSDERETRVGWLQTMADELNAAPVQHIGKLLILWRPIPEKVVAERDDDRRPGPKTVKVLKNGRGGQRPEVKQVRVLGNERLTSGGKVKRARVAQKSPKKSAR